jgi:peptidoglycan/xylan/chitin deacetylase (PgdA/CDA1 family)
MLNIKSKLITYLGPFGGFALSRLITRRVPKIIMYHRFSEESKTGYMHRSFFEAQIKYLQKNYNVIRLDGLISKLKNGQQVPPNTIVLTVDDGYRDFYDIAYPILKKYSVPATLFVTTKFVDGRFWLWPDKVKYILQHSNKLHELDKALFIEGMKSVDLPNERDRLWGVIISHLLSISENSKNEYLQLLEKTQEVNVPDCPVEQYQAIDWAQAKEMSADNIEIAAHTRSHPSLSKLTSSQLVSEVTGSVNDIGKELGAKPTSFCFPNGQPADYTAEVKEAVKQSGCHGAVTAFFDQHLIDDKFELRRFSASNSWIQFLKLINGVNVISARWLKTNNILQASRRK